MARLEENLGKAGILVEGKIVPLQEYGEIETELSTQIYDGIHYLCNNYHCEKVAQMFGKEMDEGDSVRSMIREISEEIKVKEYYSTTSSEVAVLHIAVEGGFFPIDVA